MMNLGKLLKTRPVLLEGGMGTMLIQRGLPSGQPGEFFTLEQPEVVASVHQEYVEAGARVVITNTFNSNRIRLAHSGLCDRLAKCIEVGVHLARQAAVESGIVVAGSMGPTGELLSPVGTLSKEEATDVFAEQAALLDAAGVDMFVVETMFDVEEALAAISACSRVSGKPIVACMAYSSTPRGFCTMMGNSLTDAVPRLLDAGAIAVGANCQLSCSAMEELAGILREVTPAPLWVKPNAGQPEVTDQGVHYGDSPEVFASSVVAMAKVGIEMIGGCCGTTPRHIEVARHELTEAGLLA